MTFPDLEETHGARLVARVEGEAVVDAGGEDDHVACGDVEADPGVRGVLCAKMGMAMHMRSGAYTTHRGHRRTHCPR